MKKLVVSLVVIVFVFITATVVLAETKASKAEAPRALKGIKLTEVQQITNAQAKEIRGAQTPIDDMLAKAKMQEGIKKLQETQKKTNNDIQKIKDKISNGSGSK